MNKEDNQIKVYAAHKQGNKVGKSIYLIPWDNSVKDFSPSIDDFAARFNDSERINFGVSEIKLNEILAINEDFLRHLKLVLHTSYGLSYATLDEMFEKVVYMKVSSGGEIQFFVRLHDPVADFKIFFAHHSAYYRFHEKTEYNRYAFFTERNQSKIEDVVVIYFKEKDKSWKEPTSHEHRLYQKFLDEYTIVEEN